MTGLELVVVRRFGFRAHDFAWLDVIQCEVRGAAARQSPIGILECLIRHQLYRNCYACSDAETHVTETIHGPFRLECIRVEDFVEISRAQFRASIHAPLVDDSYSNKGPADPEQIQAIDGFLDSLEAQPRQCFRLNKDRADASQTHEWGGLLDLFDEFVILDEERTSLLLVVFGAD